jgi:DNA polymerase III delta prime subunit
MNTINLPENNTKINIKLFILDPLSIIIKLAILSNKPVGTKILIQNNVLYLQEPGVFQAVCRMFFNSNKTDLQYIYNPIQIACQTFLTSEFIKKNPRIKNLFICAQNGLKKIIETYKNCSIISLCLNYYYAIITNYVEQVEQKYNDHIFYKDSMTSLYTKEVINKLNEQWTDEKIKIILDLITFLTKDNMASNNVKSLETIMENNDENTKTILNNLI